MKSIAAPVETPWMWTLAYGHHEDRSPIHGYETTREAAMVAFAKSWRQEFKPTTEVEATSILPSLNGKTTRSWRAIVPFTHLAREGRMTVTIGRRELLAALGGAAAAWPLAAKAQQSARLRTIGYLGSSTALAQSPWVAAFVRRLHELGWLEGRTVAIEYRWAEGRSERFADIAAEFVRLKVDVIVTAGTAPALAAKQATSAIPIVFPLAGDPVGNGLVASLPRPGANITGLSLQTTDIGAKRLEVLREVLPKLGRLAILANIGNAAAALEMSEVRDSARNLGLDITTLEVRRAEEIAPAFEALGGRAEALIVCGDPLVTNNRVRIITLALGARLPTMHGSREHVEAGGLMSYGPNFPDLFRRSAEYVDKILRGAKPSELPVEQPTRIDLAVNLITAKVLGLTIPQTLLARADEVIE